MLASQYSGVSSLVLVVCLVVPVIGLIIRRKWRRSVARSEEVRKLLILASEEAARAEIESYVGYSGALVSGGYQSDASFSGGYQSGASVSGGYQTGASVSGGYHSVASVSGGFHSGVAVSGGYHCAVCDSPTTTRCARCKVVRYCSGKCQIIHWRQGHKNKCHPPSTPFWSNEEGNDSCQKVSEQEKLKYYGDRLENEGRWHVEPVEMGHKEHGNIDEVRAHADKEGGNSTVESSGNSFSGFSASPTRSESSDDVSLCQSISSNGHDELLSGDVAGDMLETTFTDNDVASTEPLSPKFTRLVDSVDKFSNLKKSNRVKLGGDCGGDNGCISGSVGLGASGRFEGSVGDRSQTSSGFLDEYNESDVSKSSGAANRNLSESGSSLHFSFSLSGGTSQLNAQDSKAKSAILDDSFGTASGNNNATDSVVLTRIDGKDASTSSNSPPCESSTHIGKDSSRMGSHLSEFEVVKPLSLSESSPVHAFSSDKRISVGRNTLHISSSSVSRSELNGNVYVDATASNPLKFGEVTSSTNGKIGLKSSVLKVVDQLRGAKLSKHQTVVEGSEDLGRYDKALFSYELFVKLYTWNKMELMPCGLLNCGNSCYANAVLQCLAFTPPLTAYFLQGDHSRACTSKEWCFTCEFEKLIFKAKEGRSPVSPSRILSQLQNNGSKLCNGKEEDAHEFLRYAVETMQSAYVTVAGVDMSDSSEREETTLMGLTFGGYIQSKIKCLKCEGKSERHERIMDLAVEVDGNIGTLEEALRQFTSTELLDGENKYHCGRCNSYEKAKKKLTIHEAPNVLTIALKRFQSGKFGKLNKPIRFPEVLDLAPYMSGTSDKTPIYRLYGVVVHLDVMNASYSGHYVCYVKNIQNKWFKIDDSVVKPTELEKVLTKGAYLLLYARCSPRAPRFIRNRIASLDKKSKSNPSSSRQHVSVMHSNCTSNPLTCSASIEAFYSKYKRLRSILEDDSSSDNASLISSNSDDCSCSTESTATRDSSSTDELYDYSPLRNSSDPEISASSHLTEGNKVNAHFSNSNTTEHCRKLGDSSSSSSNSSSGYRESDTNRVERVNYFKDVKHDAPHFIKSTKERSSK